MADITVNSHDILGKLTVVKNHLAVLAEDVQHLTSQQQEYIKRAADTTQSLIDQIKQLHQSAHTNDLNA